MSISKTKKRKTLLWLTRDTQYYLWRHKPRFVDGLFYGTGQSAGAFGKPVPDDEAIVRLRPGQIARVTVEVI
jgi:hypothetical protein